MVQHDVLVQLLCVILKLHPKTELDSELEALLEDAISKCDDQTLDEYLDVDCENEEEDE